MRSILLITFFLSCFSLRAQQTADPDTTPFYLMSLEQLMNVTVTVTSQSPISNREAPGIVTILNHQEIVNTGANDLIHLLQLIVPGFDFGVDVDGVVGIGVRGNWGHEGKVLVIWDGMEMNEDLYSTLQFGNHYSLDQIKKIEVIRGPGSAMYGGNAEYAVINITTFSSKNFNGVSAAMNYAQMSKTFANRSLSVIAGKSFGPVHMNISTIQSSSTRSQEYYSDADSNTYDMTGQSAITNSQYRGDLYVKGLSLIGLCELYSVDQRDGYGANYNHAYKTDFNSAFFIAKYDLKASDRFTITPGYKFKIQRPWAYKQGVTNDAFLPFNTTAAKNECFVNLKYEPVERVSTIAGFQYYNLNAHQEIDSLYFSNGKKNLIQDNYSVYVQGIFRTKPVNIILGARYEHNTTFGCSFLPRIGLTRVWEKYHLKALYSRAFRAPSIENLNETPGIKPEKTSVIELEGGLKAARNFYITTNVYDITTYEPIIYYYDENEDDEYKNESSTGSRGFDVECKWKFEGWYASIIYSYSTTAGHNIINVYQVPGHEGKVLAFPTNELNLNSNFQLNKVISCNPSFTFMDERFSYMEDVDGNPDAERISPSLYANVNFNVKDFLCKGLMLQFGCLNFTDEKVLYIQPYNGNHRPLPGQGRQFQLKFRYNFSLGSN